MDFKKLSIGLLLLFACTLFGSPAEQNAQTDGKAAPAAGDDTIVFAGKTVKMEPGGRIVCVAKDGRELFTCGLYFWAVENGKSVWDWHVRNLDRKKTNFPASDRSIPGNSGIPARGSLPFAPGRGSSKSCPTADLRSPSSSTSRKRQRNWNSGLLPPISRCPRRCGTGKKLIWGRRSSWMKKSTSGNEISASGPSGKTIRRNSSPWKFPPQKTAPSG